MVSIRLDNVTKKFDENIAVDSVSLDINDKEFFVLLGPSGSGKSTVLNMIAGLEDITSGNIFFDDLIVNDISPEKRDAAMVFQSYALYPHLTAFKNISFGLEIRKFPKEKIEKKVSEAANILGIDHLLKRKPHELSGGERQRTALARAIVRDPKVFLLDEPLSNVDAKLRTSMRAELIRLQKYLQTTTVYVTHDQVEAMTMADRIALLDKGRLIQIGEPLEIFDHPENMFVAGFIGTPPMNFIDCSISSNINELKTKEFAIRVPHKLKELIKKQYELKLGVKPKETMDNLVLGIRPQYIDILESTPALSESPKSSEGIKSEIYAIEPLGTESIIDVKLGDSILKVLTDARIKRKMGDDIWIKFDLNRCHIFDKTTGKCII